jgi:hypothetical protein
MKHNLNYILLTGLMTILLLNSGCGIIRNPFRDGGKIPFNSDVWKKSDAFERGRMFDALTDKPIIDGLDEAGIIKLLGEPDKKRKEGGNSIFLYRIEVGHNTTLPFLGITIDQENGAFLGTLSNGKASILVAE